MAMWTDKKNPPVKRKLSGGVDPERATEQLRIALAGLEPVYVSIPGTQAIASIVPMTSLARIAVERNGRVEAYPAAGFARITISAPVRGESFQPHDRLDPVPLLMGVADYGLVHLTDIWVNAHRGAHSSGAQIDLATTTGPLRIPLETRTGRRSDGGRLGIGTGSDLGIRHGNLVLAGPPETAIAGAPATFGTSIRDVEFAQLPEGTYDLHTADLQYYTVRVVGGRVAFLDHRAVHRGQEPSLRPATRISLGANGRLQLTFPRVLGSDTTAGITEEITTALVTAVGVRITDPAAKSWLQVEAEASERLLTRWANEHQLRPDHSERSVTGFDRS